MLQGKAVLITGASSGLGRHFAKVVAENGASKIAIAARRIEKLEELKQELLKMKPTGALISCIPMDVSNISSISKGFDSIEKEWNEPAEVIINNAGISITGSFLKVLENDYDELMTVNLKGAFFVCQEAAKRLVPLKKGSIVNISSILGLRVGTDLSTYAISKAGVIQMTKAAALELVKFPDF